MNTKKLQTLESLLYNCTLSKKYFLKKDEIKKLTTIFLYRGIFILSMRKIIFLCAASLS